jgi:hypothetical protein
MTGFSWNEAKIMFIEFSFIITIYKNKVLYFSRPVATATFKYNRFKLKKAL